VGSALLLVFGAILFTWKYSMVCSKCGSEDIQRLEVSFDAGTPKEVPPVKRSLKWPGVGVFISLLLLANGGETIVFGVLTLTSSSFLGYKAYQFNTKFWPGLHKRWQESWKCRQCGVIFHHP
jgi:hypothetical protein